MTVVAVEALALLVLALTGWLLAPGRHGPGWRLAVCLPLGIAAHAAVELVLLATRLPVAHPWVAAVLALLAAAVAARLRRDGARPAAPGWVPAVGLALVVVTVAVTAAVPLVNVSADSFRYLTVSRLLVVDGDATRMSAFLLQTRSLATGAVHGLAAPELGYLRAVGPLVAASGLGALGLLVREGTARLEPPASSWVAAGAVLVVATNHRFLFNAFYVNGHLLFAVWLLLLVAVVWRRLRAADRHDPHEPRGAHDAGSRPAPQPSALGTSSVWAGDAPVAGLLAVALTVVRPEGALVVALALAPAVLEPAVARTWRQVVLVAFGAGTLLWHLGVVLPQRVASPEASLTGMVALGALALVTAALVPQLDRRLARRPLPLLAALHGLAWFAVVVLTVRDPAILVDSAGATGRNLLADGVWGVSLLLLAALLVAAVALRRVPAERALLFPLLTFVPLGILLAFLREGAYRVGPGDSLNRMLLHVLPLAVLTLALTAAGGPRGSSPGAHRRVASSRPAAD